MPTRHYFKKAIAPPPKPPKTPPPDYRRRTAMITTHEQGQKKVRLMSLSQAVSQVARSKGGRARVARGTGHFWTSETARAAVLKMWKRRRQKIRGKGLSTPRRHVWTGMKQAKRPPLHYANIRCEHSVHDLAGLTDGIYHYRTTGEWVRVANGVHQRLRETTALRHLGYLPSNRKHFVPESFREVTPKRFRRGTLLASSEGQSSTIISGE